MDPDTMFASRSVPRHLVRGVLGLAALVAAFALIPVWGPLTLLIAPVGVVLLRGCPTCWALGLVQTRAVCRARAAGHATNERTVSIVSASAADLSSR